MQKNSSLILLFTSLVLAFSLAACAVTHSPAFPTQAVIATAPPQAPDGSSSGEARIRYMIADIQLGDVAGYYRSVPQDPEIVEALRRWDACVRVTNASQFERKIVAEKGWQVVYSGSERLINGMDVTLSQEGCGSGSISGEVRYYPTDFYWPPMDVVAFSLERPGAYYSVTVQGLFTFLLNDLPAGSYHVLAYAEGYEASAGYTQASICGVRNSACTDHSLVTVNVQPGQTVTDVFTDDWLQPGFPARPAGLPTVVPNPPPSQPQAPEGNSSGEARIRYMIADIQLGDVAGYYRSVPQEAEIVEALRRWDAGIRVVNINEFERKIVEGQGWQVVYTGTERLINGMDVILSQESLPPPPPTNTPLPVVLPPNPMRLWLQSIDGCTATVNGVIYDVKGPWDWNWGDGSTDGGWFPQSHSYAASGTYRVTVSANSGESNFIFVTVSCP